MSAPSGPMRIGDMLVHTFRFMRANPAATLGIGALLATVDATVSGVVINSTLMRSDAFTSLGTGSQISAELLTRLSEASREALPWLAVTLAVSFLMQLAATGVMTLAVIRGRREEQVQPALLWNDVPWGRLLAINALVLGLIAGASVGPIAIAVFSPAFAPAALGFVIAIALFLALGTSLAVPAAMNEGTPARLSIARSFALLKGSWLRTAAALAIASIIWSGVGSFIASPVAAIIGALAGGSTSTFAQTLQTLVSSIVTGAVALPGYAISATLVYFDRASAQAQ